MRILHIYSGNLFGGVESLLCSLAQHAALTPGSTREFALCFEGPLSDRLRTLGAQIHLLGATRIRNPLATRQARRALAEVLREGSFDAAICHSAWSQALFGATVRAASVPSVFWLHDRANGRHWIERLAARLPPDVVICNSHYTRSTLGHLYPEVPSDVVYHPLPVDVPPLSANDRMAVRDTFDTPPQAVVIAQTSRMEAWKGHVPLLHALARMADDPRWVCWIAGAAQRPHEQTYTRSLHTLAYSLGIADRIRFVGQLRDISRLLAAADIHCQPNLEPEPFGIAFIEALAAGIPVVTSNLGGAREIIDERCGILVPPADVTALAAALRRLVSDSGLRTALGAQGPARARHLCEPARQLARVAEICRRASANSASRDQEAQRPAKDSLRSEAGAGIARMPWWLSMAAQLLRQMPAGRYRASRMLAHAPVRPFMARTPASLGALAFQVEWDDVMARDVCLLGVYEPQETALLRALVRPGMTCVDVGANWGYFTLLAAHLAGAAGRVIALEPDPRLFPMLHRNVEANRLAHVEVLPLAAAAAAGTFWLEGHDRTSGNRGTSRLVQTVRADAARFRVETAPIDAVLDAHGVGMVDLLKMDIEGAEVLALRGMRDGLAAHRYARILLELHPTALAEHGSSTGALVAAMLDAGYRGWWIDHSDRAVRRASYAKRLRIEDYLRPIDAASATDRWPHTLWLAPHASPPGDGWR